ncbi:RNA polymerase sigma factor SigJ [Pseudenhygromyxa sp. WMMC2535]|uniref:RNA polymerase sigma factor SigJ n=1 Tax=Pseudenhygromyxa sp. WMMC2535 TaxID=2712867 RepID=UPI0015578643|nr:RNA polymerase sigma factor SigJ [Pseudenhygromyxa sp. WMMC2535]NVB41922.1 RNA polymerase sigma factor SigJ [Pseudenhygromyxa sp. WMMC2535]
MSASTPDPSETFEALRPRLFGVAYRMTGSVADSEDILQEVYLSWAQKAGAGVEVDRPAAYLTRSVVNRARDLARSAARRREHYVGPWLPEPCTEARCVGWPGTGQGRDAEAGLELADSLRMAFMLVLDRLEPDERAVFILKDVFGQPFAEIAEIVGKSEVACRKIAERARKRVRAERPQLDLDRERTQRAMFTFLAAVESGEIGPLTAMLREDAVFLSDSGGKASAARKPVHGGENIARLMLGLRRLQPADGRVEPVWINDAPGLIMRTPAGIETCLTVDIDAQGQITAIYAIRNPDKLTKLDAGPTKK